MKKLPIIVSTLAFACLLPVPAAHAAWSVGTDMGFAFWSPEDGDGVTSIVWGGAPEFSAIFQPGLRVAFVPAGPQHELAFTSRLAFLSSSGESIHTFQGIAAYQYNFSSTSSNSLFLNGGVGLITLGDEDDTFTAPAFGVGFGIRHHMGNEHGGIRLEARFDHQNEMEDNDVTVVSAANTFGLKLGFEMWD